ncbi:hypothetical protein FAZ69_15970 [Trinickia terrae]|uniref:Uncharacterized protein n=1 Tax=Trinickia terrae TaxID=2571161 RepID=A0A4U1I3G4_9BURK|nr:hypothetical protein [Trinickia terrae]TKC87776.1 hypothetical protein FAZ69_15970 [Trinickia terrae]
MVTTRSRWIAIALIAGAGIGTSSVALAHVDIGVDIGVPGVVYAPAPVYEAPPPVIYAPQPAVVVAPGWYDDRYYDGHRYWERREWEEHHDHGWHHGWRHDHGWHHGDDDD